MLDTVCALTVLRQDWVSPRRDRRDSAAAVQRADRHGDAGWTDGRADRRRRLPAAVRRTHDGATALSDAASSYAAGRDPIYSLTYFAAEIDFLGRVPFDFSFCEVLESVYL